VWPAEAASGPPQTIPALENWIPATGSYHLVPASRIVVDGRYVTQLSTTASVFADDLGQLVGRVPAVVTGSPSGLAAGDILLSLAPSDTTLGTEGYRLAVGSSVTVQAPASTSPWTGCASTSRSWPI
jgi:hexosaminidase